jgi:sulfate adenylyltransferase
LPRGGGPHWDPAIRRRPEDVRRTVAEAGQGSVLAIVVDEPPSNDDLDVVADAIDRSGPSTVLCVVAVSRRRRPPGSVSWAGLTRAAAGLAAELAAAGGGERARPRIHLVAVPWPGTEAAGTATVPGPSFDDVLAAYGATGALRIGASRSPETVARLADAPVAFERAVRALYPPASAAEIVRAGRGSALPGAVVFFTGLSGSGKSTIARALADELGDDDGRLVTLLDGDEVRAVLSADLGFDAASREANIARIGYVAALVAAHGGIAIAAPIAPFAAGRRRARSMVRPPATFLLVHVSTPLEVCEARDRKGLYASARAGRLPEFTGISSPYEPPDDADVVIDTTTTDVAEAVAMIRAVMASSGTG